MKYQNDPYCKTNNVILPVLYNQKMNAYLKEISDLCGIEKNFTSHLARHTFATTVNLNNNVPLETVSNILGHSSINMTKIFARLLDEKAGNDMEHLKPIFNTNIVLKRLMPLLVPKKLMTLERKLTKDNIVNYQVASWIQTF